MKEERTSKRFATLLKVSYSEPPGLADEHAANLSVGGVFIHTAVDMRPGQRLVFTLSFPGLLEPFEVRGVVRWREPSANKGGPGVGVQLELDQAQRKRVEQIIASLRAVAEFHDTPTEKQSSPLAIETPYRVLLVEDNTFVQEMFSFAVQIFHGKHEGNRSLELYCAESADEALDILQSAPIDLAIVDHFMPGMTGCELVAHMRADEGMRDIAILVVSGGGLDVRDEAMASGADLYLEKPVKRRELVDTIAALAAQRRGFDVDGRDS